MPPEPNPLHIAHDALWLIAIEIAGVRDSLRVTLKDRPEDLGDLQELSRRVIVALGRWREKLHVLREKEKP